MATTTQWTDGNGNWTDRTWTNGVPDSTTDAIIDGTSANPVTVTFDTPSGAALALEMEFATLAVDSGTLALGSASRLDALTQSGGRLDFAAGGTIAGPLSQTAGDVAVDSGTLLVDDGGTFAGRLVGAGEIIFAAGDVTLGSGLGLSVGSLVVENATTLNGEVVDIGGFTLAAGGTLDLNGQIFQTQRRTSLSGVVEGKGALEVGLHGTVDGLTATAGANIADYGSLTSQGLLTLGTSATDAAHLIIEFGGTYNLKAGGSIAAKGSSAILNDGVLEDTAQYGTISIAGDVTNNGVITITNETGSFHIFQTSTLLLTGGTFNNQGAVDALYGDIVFGPGVVDTNMVNGILTGGIWDAYNGTLAITGGPITTLDAHVILDGSGPGSGVIAAGNGTSFKPLQESLTTIAKGGVLEVDLGGYQTRRNVVDYGTIELSGEISSGQDQFGSLSIAAGGELQVSGTLYAQSVRSDGTVMVSNGFDTSSVVFSAPFASVGTLEAEQPLELAETGNVLSGRVFINTLILDSGTSTRIGALAHSSRVDDLTLEDDATLALAASFADAGTFVALGGATLDLGGQNLTLEYVTSLDGNGARSVLVNGGGTLGISGGPANATLGYATLTGGTKLTNKSIVTESGPLTLGDAAGGTASIENLATGTYITAGAVALTAASATADTITNDGLFEKTGTGTATIGAAFTNTGTIEVAAGTLEITAPFANTGSIIGTEIQSNGTAFITAPSAALFNQYAAGTKAAGSESLVHSPPGEAATATLAQPAA